MPRQLTPAAGAASTSNARPVPEWATSGGAAAPPDGGFSAFDASPALTVPDAMSPTGVGEPGLTAVRAEGRLPPTRIKGRPGRRTARGSNAGARPPWGLAVLGGIVAVGVTALVVVGAVWMFGLVGDSGESDAAAGDVDGPGQVAPAPDDEPDEPAGNGDPELGDRPGAPEPEPPEAELPPGFPPEAVAAEGQQYWAVVADLAYDADDPDLALAWDSVRELGYKGELGDVDCLRGARETFQLDADREYSAVSVLFGTEQQAQQFVSAYEPGVVGTSQVLDFCAT